MCVYKASGALLNSPEKSSEIIGPIFREEYQQKTADDEHGAGQFHALKHDTVQDSIEHF